MSTRKPQPPSPRRGGGSAGTSSALHMPPTPGFSLTRPSSSPAAAADQHRLMSASTANSTASAKKKALNGGVGGGGVSTASVGGGSSSDGFATIAQWRSSVLHYEVAMRELTASSNRTGPSLPRMTKVLALWDGFTDCSPHIEVILKLFRLEFCRAIFPGTLSKFASGNSDGPVMGVSAYFDLVDSVAKEKAILEAELDSVESDSSVETLKKQLHSKQSLVSFYEHEVTRLTNENKRANEEINRMAADVDSTSKQHHASFASMDEECQRLTKENRELQLQVFKLGKDNREQAAGQGIYSRLKQSKYDTYQHMFLEGNEEASLLVVMHQLEALENEALEDFEQQLFKSTVGEMPGCRSGFARNVQLLLEEYHASDFRRKSLKSISRGDPSTNGEAAGFRLRATHATGMDPEELLGEHDRRVQTESKQKKQSPLESPLGSFTNKPHTMRTKPRHPSPQQQLGMSISGLRDTPAIFADSSKPLIEGLGEDIAEDLAELKKMSRKFWSGKHFGNMYDRGLSHVHHLATAWDAQRTLHQPIVAPLLDVSTTKFLVGLDIFATTPTENAQFLKTVQYLDPASGIELPPKCTSVKVKYTNPLVRDSTMADGLENLIDKHVGVPEPADWVAEAQESSPSASQGRGSINPQKRPGTRHASTIDESSPSSPMSPSRRAKAPLVKPTGQSFQGPQWTVYKRTYGTYTPFLPRILDVHHVDQLMLQVFNHHHRKLMSRFEACHEVATSRSTGTAMAQTLAERLFRDDYTSHDLQTTLLEVLETRYVYPEVAMKVYYEVLTSLEKLQASNPYCKAYTECLAHQAIPSLGLLLSLNLHLLATYWPLSPTQANEAISERDLASVLKGMYPSESQLKVNTEELVNDILISTKQNLTLNGVRDHFAASILNQKEPVLLKLHQMFLYRAGAVHWSELDFNEFWETIKTILTEDFHTQAFVKQVYACCVSRKPARLSPSMLAYIAAELLWNGAARHHAQAL